MNAPSDEDPDRISSLGRSDEVELRVKGSRFFARTFPAFNRDELELALNENRSRYPDATHHCWGARFLNEERSNDEGEPAGTAGEPILRVLQGAQAWMVGWSACHDRSWSAHHPWKYRVNALSARASYPWA